MKKKEKKKTGKNTFVVIFAAAGAVIDRPYVVFADDRDAALNDAVDEFEKRNGKPTGETVVFCFDSAKEVRYVNSPPPKKEKTKESGGGTGSSKGECDCPLKMKCQSYDGMRGVCGLKGEGPKPCAEPRGKPETERAEEDAALEPGQLLFAIAPYFEGRAIVFAVRKTWDDDGLVEYANRRNIGIAVGMLRQLDEAAWEIPACGEGKIIAALLEEGYGFSQSLQDYLDAGK